ncbi:MAG: exodeoxyribonuclease VII small subunit [Prevotellaceae bacterium]|jgi:exodeoxyribonuclease VII small subunit|nr:exodeoxyribonuclease VII small subunit [Prevotellaceae bacterium]
MKDKKTTTPIPQEEKKLTYLEAVKDLGRIINSMEGSELNMDDLSAKVHAATQRLEYCQKALHEIEENVIEMMKANALYTPEIERLMKK